MTGLRVADLTPLKTTPLEHLDCSTPDVRTLEPIKGLRLQYLACGGTKVTDFTPLLGMPLARLNGPIDPPRDARILRKIPTLAQINNIDADKYWKDAGIP